MNKERHQRIDGQEDFLDHQPGSTSSSRKHPACAVETYHLISVMETT
jgi:hypothetical protein